MSEDATHESDDDGLVRTSSAEIRRLQQREDAAEDEEAPESSERFAAPPDDDEPPEGSETEGDDDDDEDDEDDAVGASEGAPEQAAEPGLESATPAPGYRTIDEVARRHADDEGDGDEAEAAPAAPGRRKARKKRTTKKKTSRKGKTYPATRVTGAPTPVEQTGMFAKESVQVKTAQDAVPYEGDPLQDPHVVAVGLIEPAEGEQFPDMSGSEARQPANLSDICRLYRLGPNDGDCHLRVERKAPKQYQGVTVEGYLGKIRRPIDEAEFRDMAGGGVYEVVVWGPNPRGTVDPYTGHVEVKPLTKPIIIKMPGAPSHVDFDEDDQPGRRNNMQGAWDPMERRRVPVTTAEASLQKEALGFFKDSVKDAKDENRRLQAELKERTGAPGVDQGVVSFLKDASKEGLNAVRESSQRQAEYLEKQLAQERARAERLEQQMEEWRNQQRAAPDREYSGMAQLISAISPARDQSGDIQRIYEQHVREMDRATAQHERAMEQLRGAYDERLRSKDEEIRRAQEHYDKREQQLRDEMQRREQQIRDDAERRERDLKDRYDQIIARQKEDHVRELENLKRQEELVRETNKVSWETRIASAEERATTAREEAERAREEAARKADLPSMIQEYSEIAGALGFKKDEEDQPKDWKERLAQSFGAAVENLPTLFERANETFQSRAQMIQSQTEAMRTAAAARAPQGAPRQAPRRPQGTIRGAGGAPVNVRRAPGWSTEDGLSPRTYTSAPEPELRPEQTPPPTEEDRRRAEAERHHQELHGNPRPAPAPEPSPPSAQAAPPPAPSAPSNGAMTERQAPKLPPEMVEQTRQSFELAYQQGAEPEEVAADLHQAWGSAMLRNILSQLSVEELIEALSSDPKAASSPLLTRDGTTWFRQVWAAGEHLVSAAG